ncbi:sulfotransferase family protein [Synechococcus sp. AH-601-P18]|nr:sulfotransferase family protein [Synechococcus sp. AH-601-P18]
MISHQHETIFIHIPKCAGTSVERVFLEDINVTWQNRGPLLLRINENHDVGPPRLAHLTYDEYTKFHYISRKLFRKYFKFSICRNPYSRTYSLYKYTTDQTESFDFFACSLKEKLSKSEHFWFFRPQTDFIFNKNGDLAIDFLGRLETIDKDFAYIRKKSYLKALKLPQRNISEPKKCNNTENSDIKEIKQSLSKQAIGQIIELYQRDFELLGYET